MSHVVPGSPLPSLAETLQAQLNAARKAQDKSRTLLLGTTLAALKNRGIEVRRALTAEEVIVVLRKGLKTHGESVEQVTAANRMDAVQRDPARIRG